MGNIKLSEVKNLLLEGLQPLAEKHGYKIVKSKFAMVRKEKHRTTSLDFLTYSWNDEIRIRPRVVITHKEINDIVLKLKEKGNIENLKDQCLSMDLLLLQKWYDKTQIENYGLNNDDVYTVHNYTTDIIHTINEISNKFEQYGLRYIEEFSSIKGIDTLLNSKKIEQFNLHATNMFTQIFIGLIASFILDIDFKNTNEKYITLMSDWENVTQKKIFFELQKLIN